MSEFEDLHDELRAVARDLLGKAARAPGGTAEADWGLLARSGWLGLEVPERLGGAGATFAEVAVVLEEMGRAATPSPYLGTVVLGVGALALLAPGPGRDELLGGVAAGDLRLAVAVADGADDLATDAPPFRLERPAGGLVLHGRAGFVPDAAGADRLLVLAQGLDGGPVVVDARPTAEPRADAAAGRPHPHDERPGPAAAADDRPAVRVTPQPVLDATRRLGLVEAEGVAVAADRVWRFAADPEASARRLVDRAAVAVACDSLGLAEAMLAATVAYAGVRQQFGRPIGSFQAVKHRCADMLVQVSVARELVTAAVRAVATGDPGAGAAASMAKSYAGAAAVDVVGAALQLHGGIGYTWESDVHVYLKRAALDRSLFGSPGAHRRRLAGRFPVASDA